MWRCSKFAHYKNVQGVKSWLSPPVGGEENQVGKKGRGRGMGKGEVEGKRKGKGKGREGSIFFPRERGREGKRKLIREGTGRLDFLPCKLEHAFSILLLT